MPHDPVTQAIDRIKTSPDLSPAIKLRIAQEKANRLEALLATAHRIIADQSAALAKAHAALKVAEKLPHLAAVFQVASISGAPAAEKALNEATAVVARAITLIEGSKR